MGKNLLVIDCEVDEVLSFASELKYKGSGFEIKSYISNWKRTGKLSELKRYFIYFSSSWKTFLSRKQYDAVIGWQQFYALIYSFYCNLFKVKKCNLVVAVNFTYKAKRGFRGKVYEWFIRKCLSPEYLDYLHVPSFEYAELISSQFDFPRARIIVTTFGVDDCYPQYSQFLPPDGYSKNGYALAIGRSNRDFDFLINAWEDIEYPLVVIGDTYKGTTKTNKKVVIRRDIAGVDSYKWIANCNIMIIPIDDPSICSGDTVLLNSMACKKNVVITRPSTLAEMYIRDRYNGYTVEKTKKALEEVVKHILQSDETVGINARESFLYNFSRKAFGLRITEKINDEV